MSCRNGDNRRAGGRVFFHSIGLTGGGSEATFRNASIDDGVTLIQTNVTIPENQVGPPQTLKLPFSFRVDATGENYIYSGWLWGGGGDVVAVNNVVVAQDDMPLPAGYVGYFSPDAVHDGATVSPYGGHYAFRSPAVVGAHFADVVVVDGWVVAATGAPIVPGSSEVWDGGFSSQPFVFHAVNSRGDYLDCGCTNGPIPELPVMVWNGHTVVMRVGDPIDLNADGLPDSGVSAGTPRGGYLTDHGRFYFTCTISPTAEGFLWMPVPVPGEVNCDGSIDFFDIDPFILALFDPAGYAAAYPDCWRITADLNRDGSVDFFDIDPFLECLFGDCP